LGGVVGAGAGAGVVLVVPVEDPVDELVDGVVGLDGAVAVPVEVVDGLLTVGVRVGVRNIRPNRMRPTTNKTPAIVVPLERGALLTVTRSSWSGGVCMAGRARRSSEPGPGV
jgi:hypothetical protein